jgi:hypothetical protein
MENKSATLTENRYQVRIIKTNECLTLGDIVATATTPTEAKKKAGELAGSYYYGVAIVDIEDGIVDAGECDGKKLIFELRDVAIAGRS